MIEGCLNDSGLSHVDLDTEQRVNVRWYLSNDNPCQVLYFLPRRIQVLTRSEFLADLARNEYLPNESG